MLDRRTALTLLVALIATLQHFEGVAGHQTPCNQNNDTKCLEGVREEFVRNDYWFGDDYFTRCPNGTANMDFFCMNADVVNKNISSRMLRKNDFDPDMIEQFLEIRYNTPAGSYMACGHAYDVKPFSMNSDIDNTHTIYYDMWILGHRPSITFQHTPGETYTLVAYDAGYIRLGGIWVNIKTGDTATGEEIYPHMGPVNPMYELRNPFVYALFRQTGGDIINLGAQKAKIMENIMDHNGHYHLDEFIMDNNLEGPIAVGYIVVKTDPYGIQHYVDRNVFNNCPFLVSKNPDVIMALKVMGYEMTEENSHTDYRGTYLKGLQVQMSVTHSSPEAHFDSCCKHLATPMTEVSLDPLDDTPVMPVYTRNQPHVQLSPVELRASAQAMSKMYTLLLLDITDAVHNNSNQDVVIHWEVMNIQHGRVAEGDTVLPYMPPIPKQANEMRIFLYLLLTQPQRIATDAVRSYTTQACPEMLRGRCSFDLEAFMRYLNMKVAGLTMFKSEQDDFARAVLYGSVHHEKVPSSMSEFNTMPEPDVEPMMTEEEVCGGMPGYERPCPDKCKNDMSNAHSGHH